MSLLEPHHGAVGTGSNAQLALALAVVKSKPSNTTIKDFILGIRSHVRGGGQERDWRAPDKHLDSIAFWQQAYEKSESAQSQLLDRIYELEQRNDALLAKLRPAEDAKEPPKTSSKRKANGHPAATQPSKRAKRTATPRMGSLTDGLIGQGHDRVPEFDYVEASMAPFLRQFHWLRHLLQKKLNVRSVSLTVVELCKSGERSIIAALEPMKKPTATQTQSNITLQSPRPDILSILLAIERSYPSLLQCLKRVLTDEEGKASTGLITYQMILLFEAILNGLHRHSTIAAKEDVAQAKQSKKPKSRVKTNTVRAKPASASAETAGGNIPGQIARLLEAMILSLDQSILEQCSLLEGYLFVLLERVGKILCLFVLGDLQSSPQLQIDPSHLPLPSGLAKTSDDEVTRKAAEGEARCLIGVLEKALAFVDQNRERMIAISRNNASPTCYLFDAAQPNTDGENPSTNRIRSIAGNARERLQNTLLKAVFGDEDPAFDYSLPAPKLSAPIFDPDNQGIAPPGIKDTSEWFTQEVWRLLGWDILARV